MPLADLESGGAVLLLVALRTTAWLFLAPPFATSGLPRTVKVMLAVLLAAVVTPSLPRGVSVTSDTAAFLGNAVLQVVIGAALGFGTYLVFAAIDSAGSLLDLAGGFSLSPAYDPLRRESDGTLSRLYGLLATVLALVTPAHQYLILGFVRSFRSVPPDATLRLSALSRSLTTEISNLFVSALQIAGPLMVVLFIADIALGLLNRIAPQLNAFSLSFPLKILLTLTLGGMAFTLFPNIVRTLAEHAAGVMHAIVS